MSIRFERSIYSGEMGVIEDDLDVGGHRKATTGEVASIRFERSVYSGEMGLIEDRGDLITRDLSKIFKLGEFERKERFSATSDKVITGLATSYREIHFFEGKYDLFAENCFDELCSMKGRHPVSFQLDHNPSTKMGDTSDRLELFSDSDGLWFRFYPSASAKHQTLVRDIAKNQRSAVSVGFAPMRCSYFKMHGHKIRMIHEAYLAEISLSLSLPGAVKSAEAILVGADGLRPLSAEVKAGSLDVIRAKAIVGFGW